MPYTGPGDDSLPDYVQKLSEAKRKHWVGAFNGRHSSCISDGGSAKDCELSAFAVANAAVKGSDQSKDVPFEDWEYLIHHIEVGSSGEEQIHHCLLNDHIANQFEQRHLSIENGRALLDGEEITDGVFHVIIGLEPTQEVAWTDKDAVDKGIRPKAMTGGMTSEQKAQEW